MLTHLRRYALLPARALACCCGILLAFAVLSPTTPARAEPKDLNQVDSVLDRLEKRLLDDESEGLTFDERNRPAGRSEPAAPPTKKLKFGKARIESGGSSEQTMIKNITTAVSELESQIDLLATNVQKTKQSVLDEASIDNHIDVEAVLSDTDAAAIKSLKIKLDGYPLYELDDTSGLWLPSKSVPLYSGPLQPGTHRLDLEARLVVRGKESLPVNGNVYRFVNKTFQLAVPGGTTSSRYVITITTPTKIEETADATIKEII